jgi:Nif-specific regulatory protein
MSNKIEDTSWEALQKERDLYWRLLELGEQKNLKPLLREALSLIVGVTRAKKAYLALYPGEQDEPGFEIAHSCSEDELVDIRQKISHRIISSSMATGGTIRIDSALEDPLFQDGSSVQGNQIEAVLCVPIQGEQPLGVLYLQDREIGGAFSLEDQRRAEAFSRHIAPFVDRLLSQRKTDAKDYTLGARRRLQLDDIIGKSECLSEVLTQLEGVSRFDVSVLLTGPSGTGKTSLARVIHDNGARAKRPFLELNCAAFPENLFESELFGAALGAHSTATRKILGKLAAAEGGTLLLDEIGELSLNLQSKLLQFLQSKEYFPLGSNKAERADVRIIAATNAELELAVSQKRFREDLYYRLNVVSISVPSLAERREDIPLLIEYFCQRTQKKHKTLPLLFSSAAMRAAQVSDWPGNIRQLSHSVEAAMIRASIEGCDAVELRHLFPESKKKEASGRLQFHEATRRFQKNFLLEALESTQWNVSETAKLMGLTRAYTHNLITSFSLRAIDPRKKTEE